MLTNFLKQMISSSLQPPDEADYSIIPILQMGKMAREEPSSQASQSPLLLTLASAFTVWLGPSQALELGLRAFVSLSAQMCSLPFAGFSVEGEEGRKKMISGFTDKMYWSTWLLMGTPEGCVRGSGGVGRETHRS